MLKVQINVAVVIVVVFVWTGGEAGVVVLFFSLFFFRDIAVNGTDERCCFGTIFRVHPNLLPKSINPTAYISIQSIDTVLITKGSADRGK